MAPLVGIASIDKPSPTNLAAAGFSPAARNENYVPPRKLRPATLHQPSHQDPHMKPEQQQDMPDRPDQIAGGCLCGAIRYTIDFPDAESWPPGVSLSICTLP